MANIKAIVASLVVVAISALVALAGSQGSATSASGLPLFLVCAAVGFVLHWLVFLPSFVFQTEHYFDLTGSISYLGTVGLAVALHPAPDLRGLLLAALVAVWAIRLGSFLFMRVKKRGKDSRFDELKTHFFRFLFTWTLGGAWVFMTTAAALAAITSTESVALGPVAVTGLVLWLVGFAIEIVADKQKSRFRAESDNSDKFISTGLWARSRHPNYFGEILLWIGVALIALPVLSGWQWVTLISPLFVILLLTRVSGVPMLEKAAEEKWGDDAEYRAYVERTPVLIPSLRDPRATQ